jgi:hypothetical protein
MRHREEGINMAAAQLDDIWEQAAAHYRHHLSDRDRKRIKTITSPQELQELTQTLRKEYGDHRVAGALEKTQVFVDQLRSFTRTITIFAQTDKIASLVWGSLALIVEVSPCCRALSRSSRVGLASSTDGVLGRSSVRGIRRDSRP